MFKTYNLLLFAVALLMLGSLTSCEMETSDNGKLDGFWHLEQIDTLATGGVGDYRNQRVFWGIEHKLISVSDYDTFGQWNGYYFRFNQTGDSLILSSPYLNHWHQDKGEDGGDIPVTEMSDTLRRCGINQLTERYYKEALTGSKMILTTKELRLKFSKF